MKILTITGWGQRLDALMPFAEKIGDASYLPYVIYPGIEKVISESVKRKPDIIVGWSLGGQLAARAVASGTVMPKLLVLLAPPFQYVKDGEYIEDGVHHFAFAAFRTAYSTFPSNTLRKFGVLMCQNDDQAMNIIATMDDDKKHHKGWVRWLDELGRYSCRNMDFSNFPRTVIFHGDGDMVTNVEQGKMFHSSIRDSRLEILKNCGHAPHLHAPDFVTSVINAEAKNAAIV